MANIQKQLISSSLGIFILLGLFIAAFAVPFHIMETSTLMVVISLSLAIPLVIHSDLFNNRAKNTAYLEIATLIVTTLTFLLIFAGSKIFHSESYYSTLKTSEESKLTSAHSTQILDKLTSIEVRTVSKKMAYIKASKVLAQQHNGKNISSQYELENGAQVLVVNGVQQWVIPLAYRGLFKWMALDEIPGYVTVSATDTKSNAKLVIKPFKISKSAWFGENADRLAWWHSDFKPTDSHFEIDDNGNPHIVTVVYEKDIVWSLKKIYKVILFDAKGIKTEYSPKEVPDWVDIIYTEDLIQDYLSWNGGLADGIWNYWFIEHNVEKPTVTNLLNIIINGKQYYYTGMTSPSLSDESLITARLIDPVSGEQTILQGVSGFMDSDGALVAMTSGLPKTANQWYARLPVLKMINNEFYYLGSIISDSGIYQKAVAVKADDQSSVIYAKDLQSLIEKIHSNALTLDNGVNNIDNETISISKKKWLLILKKIEELNELKDSIELE